LILQIEAVVLALRVEEVLAENKITGIELIPVEEIREEKIVKEAIVIID